MEKSLPKIEAAEESRKKKWPTKSKLESNCL